MRIIIPEGTFEVSDDEIEGMTKEEVKAELLRQLGTSRADTQITERTPPPPVLAPPDDYLTSLEGAIGTGSKAVIRHGVPAAGGALGALAGLIPGLGKVPGMSQLGAGAGQALGELSAQAMLDEEPDLQHAGTAGAIGIAAGPAAKGVMGIAGWLRRLRGQKGADLAAVTQGVERSAPTLGSTSGTVEGLRDATQGQGGKLAAQEAMQREILPLGAQVDPLYIPSMIIPGASTTTTLEYVMHQLRKLSAASKSVGTASETASAVQAAKDKASLLEELYFELSQRAGQPLALLQAIRLEYAKAMEVSRLFGSGKAGELPSALNLGAGSRSVNMEQLQKNLLSRDKPIGKKVYPQLDPLREAAYRGGQPGYDALASIPLPFAWKLGMPGGRMKLPFTRYTGNALPNPSSRGLETGLRLLGPSHE